MLICYTLFSQLNIKFKIMKKVFVIGFALLSFANIANAGSLGFLQESILTQRSLTVGLNQSPTGLWYLFGNTRPDAVSAEIKENQIQVKGLLPGVSKVSACADLNGNNCITLNVNVEAGQVLGTSIFNAHPEGSWVKNNSTVFYVTVGGIIPVPSWSVFINNGGKANLVQEMNEADMLLPLLSQMTEKDDRVK